jgi:predicted signal transduction protein with EAL and GGDEF domain
MYVNLEPSTLTRHTDVIIDALAERAENIQVVVEITERALAADVAGILAGAERLRAAGCAIALDDVGIEPASLAFIPLARPEVVKLDLALLRTTSDPNTITVAGAVRAYAEQSGAEVVAEGIETAHDLTRALVLGSRRTAVRAGLLQPGAVRRPPDPADPAVHPIRPGRVRPAATAGSQGLAAADLAHVGGERSPRARPSRAAVDL